MTTWLWAQPDPGRARDTLFRVVGASAQRPGRGPVLPAPDERVGWPERRPVQPGGTAEEERAARARGARAFTLWRDPEGREALAHVVTLAASRRDGAEYEVRGAPGETLGVIRREPGSLWRLRRARWSVRQLDRGAAPATARKGLLRSWFLWLPSRPFQLLLTAFTMGEYAGAEPPRRLRFREPAEKGAGRSGRVVLDFRGGCEDLQVVAGGWDRRVTAALLLLLHSWESPLGRSGGHRSFV